jgi:hypothetical protein
VLADPELLLLTAHEEKLGNGDFPFLIRLSIALWGALHSLPGNPAGIQSQIAHSSCDAATDIFGSTQVEQKINPINGRIIFSPIK